MNTANQLQDSQIDHIDSLVRGEGKETKCIASPQKAKLLDSISLYLKENDVEEDTIKQVARKLYYQIGEYNGGEETFASFSYDGDYQIPDKVAGIIDVI